MISDQDSFVFFKNKVRCAVAQIKAKGHRVSVASYCISKNARLNVWETEQNKTTSHPLGFFLENQKILRDKTKINAVARRLGCKPEFIEYFIYGLKGESEYDITDRGIKKTNLKFKFFLFGKQIRTSVKDKKMKREF